MIFQELFPCINRVASSTECNVMRMVIRGGVKVIGLGFHSLLLDVTNWITPGSIGRCAIEGARLDLCLRRLSARKC